MMKSLLAVFVTLIITLLSACQSTTTKVDYNKNTNFAQFKSFQLLEKNQTASNENPILRHRISSAIASQLEKQGFAHLENMADLSVNFYFSQQEQQDDSSFSIGFGGIGIGRHSSTGISIGTTIPLNSQADFLIQIVININHQGKVIWHGSDSYIAAQNVSPEQQDKLVQNTVNNMLKQFPSK